MRIARYRQRVTVLRAPLVAGAYGRQTRDWPAARGHELVGTMQPLSSSEDSDDQAQTLTRWRLSLTRWRLYVPGRSDLLATDRVRWAGVEGDLEVDGDVERWPRHTRAALRPTELAGMVDPVTITRRTAATDAEGRPAAPATVASVLGLVAELTGSQREQGGALGQETTAQAVLPLGTDVRAQDDLTVTYEAVPPRTYRVVAVHAAVEALLVDLRQAG